MRSDYSPTWSHRPSSAVSLGLGLGHLIINQLRGQSARRDRTSPRVLLNPPPNNSPFRQRRTNHTTRYDDIARRIGLGRSSHVHIHRGHWRPW